MPDLTNEALFAFSQTADAETEWLIDSFEIEEAYNRPYDITCVLRTKNVSADPYLLLGTDVTLTISRPLSGLERPFHGIVSRVERGAVVQGAEERTSTIHIVPALFALGRTLDTRIFQELTAPEIIQRVLEEALSPYKRELQLRLVRTYEKREYCVQFRESNFAFVSRLMEEEGIGYYFDHSRSRELLCLFDSNSAASAVKTLEGEAPIPFRKVAGQVMDREGIYEFGEYRRLASTEAQVRDYDWQRPALLREEKETISGTESHPRQIYEHDEAHVGKEVAKAKLLTERFAMDSLGCQGVSQVVNLAPGTFFEIVEHPSDSSLDGKYLVTRVTHRSASAPQEREASIYHNRFECIPIAQPYRPAPVHPRPRVPSAQTAIVVGPSGEEIHTDEHGRVKVQFHWDRHGRQDDKSSCFLRVVQPWAGAGWGSVFLPRIGMEVIVSFIDGDPDRPFVSGCLYNGANPPPYSLPANKTRSAIKSNTTPGGNGSNELRFEDKAGSEEIYVHAQRDYNEVVEHDHTTTVRHDQTQDVTGNQIERITGNQSMTVNGTRTVHVVRAFSETLDSTETRRVTGKVTETLLGSEHRTITGGRVETLTDVGETRTITGAVNHTTTGNVASSVIGNVGETVSGTFTQAVTGAIAISSATSISITCPPGVTLVTSQETEAKTNTFETGVFSGSAYVNELEFALSALDITNLRISLTLASIELGVTSIDIGKFKYENEPVKIQTLGQAIKVTALTAATSGLTVFM